MKFALTKRKMKQHHAMIVVAWVFLCFFLMTPMFLVSDQGSAHENKPKSTFPVAQEREPVKKFLVVATAYSSEKAQTDSTPCIPADGYNLCDHYEEYGSGNTVAANFLPLQTKMRIPQVFGDKIFVVRDRMNKRYGYGRIDVWVPTREEAKAFGVKYLEIELFGGGRQRVYRVAKR